jgi:hypothetical protein
MSRFINDILFVMKTVEERTGLTGAQKRVIALDTLVASGLIREDEREMAGAAIDTIAWAAKHRNDIKAFAKRGWSLCC